MASPRPRRPRRHTPKRKSPLRTPLRPAQSRLTVTCTMRRRRWRSYWSSSRSDRSRQVVEHGVELTLMLVSVAAAVAGIGIAVYFFLRNRPAAARMADRFAGTRDLLLNKYYVDEIYDAAVVQPIRIVSEDALWKVVDVRVIDGVVNGVGAAVAGTSQRLRLLQSGSVRTYAASLFFGVVLILGYYLWR
jgi:NADH:ubiquinone oxidoreductase subunit 5 (subunit L)/multisubunit Na+/H+ antiporter MnhA subunit